MSGAPAPGDSSRNPIGTTVRPTANPTIGGRFSDRRRIYAILAASAFLVGSVGDSRPCPHHESLPVFVSAQFSTHGEPGDESDRGVAYEGDQRDATSGVHECLCVDMCAVDAPTEETPSDSEVLAPAGIADARPASAKQVFHPRPTAVLIPLPNAPPSLV